MYLSRNLSWKYACAAESFFSITDWWRVWFLDMRFFRITRSTLDLSQIRFLCTHRRFCFYGFNDCNSVHYQCEQKSVMLILCLHLLPIDNVFLRRRNARWWTTVYVCLHGPYARTWWEQLDSFSGHNHPDHIHRRCYAISREWNITNSLGACKFVISSNASWYSKKLMNRVDFSEPPLRGCKWC